MKNFDISTTKIGQAVQTERIFPSAGRQKFLSFFSICFWLLLLVFIALAATSFFSMHIVSQVFLEHFFGALLLLGSFTFCVWVCDVFLEYYWSRVALPVSDEPNLANFLDLAAARVAWEYCNGFVEEISALLLPILKMPGADYIWHRLGISSAEVKENLSAHLATQKNESTSLQSRNARMTTFVETCLADMGVQEGVTKLISWQDMLVTLSSESEFLKQFLFDRHVEKKDIRIVAGWEKQKEEEALRHREFWTEDSLMQTRGIGQDWVAAYTINLDRYTRNMEYEAASEHFSGHAFGRQKEMESIERILARGGENNVVLVGEAGVGKKTMLYALSENIGWGKTLPELAHKRVLSLDLGAVLSGDPSAGAPQDRFKSLLEETAHAGNIILVIDNIQTLFESSSQAGSINATELLLPYLSSGTLQVIGMTDHVGYHLTIEKNSALLKIFEKVEMLEPSAADVFDIIQDVIPRIESHDNIIITYGGIRKAIELADRYIHTSPFPEKAIDLLQEAGVHAKTHGSTLLLAEDVEAVVAQKTNIPIGNMAQSEKEKLLDLEKVLHERIIGQDEAIVAISNSLRRARSGITSAKRPIGSFLFLGPTGVGKTETAKALAAVYFGSEKHMIRFDMSEYSEADSVHRLVGFESQGGQLTQAVNDAPFSLILLDEIEKAHPDILNLFLQVLDDGRLTDALGKTVDFTNTIIIATSNAGAEFIREKAGDDSVHLKEELLQFIQTQGLFKPEFLNRFDAVITFRPLSQDETRSVVVLLVADLNARLKAQDITVTLSDEAIQKIIEVGYDKEFGARPLRRALQDRVENLIAKKLLAEEIHRGDTVTLGPNDIGEK